MPKRSKLEKEILDLLQREEAICAVVSKLNTPKAARYVASTAEALAQIRGVLRMSRRPVPLAKVRAGLLQGLRESPLVLQSILAEASSSDREKLASAIDDAASGLPGFLTGQADKAREVMRRGVIRNEEEWYLLRWRLDQIEGHGAHQEEVTLLWRLLDAYEADTQEPPQPQ